MANMLPTPEAIALLKRYFSDAMEKKHLHSFYTCCGKCSDTSEAERARIKSQKKNKRREKEGSWYVQTIMAHWQKNFILWQNR